jgi:4-amino-4-deoxy-L-arabinose transferase-like glycosyltransferase
MTFGDRATYWFCASTGFLLLAIPFLPIQDLFPEVIDIRTNFRPIEWLLGVVIVSLLSWCGALLYTGPLPRPWKWFGYGLKTHYLVLLLAVLLVELVLVSCFAFNHRPHLIDSIVHLFQARIFASGMIWAPQPDLLAFFLSQHLLMDAGRWYSQYPPGHSMLLSLGELIGLAWLVPVLLSLLSAYFVYRFAGIIYDGQVAVFSLLLFIICPFFLFMGGSFMNHTSMMFSVSLFAFAFAKWEENDRLSYLLLAAAALGLGFTIRPLTTIAVGAVFALFALPAVFRERKFLHSFVGLAAFGAVSSVYFLYNAATTGDPLLPGYYKLWGAQHGLGFHESPWGEAHTVLTGIRNELIDLSLLNEYLFEWPIPSLWAVALFIAFCPKQSSWDYRLIVAFLAFPLAYLFYWHRDQFLGPRFLFSSLVFLIPLCARALVSLGRFFGDKEIPGFLSFKPMPLHRWFSFCLIFMIAYGVFVGIPSRASIYASSFSSMKLDLAKQAKTQGLERGLVFIPVSWGNRLLAQMRELGVTASKAEVIYRQVDHCELQILVDSLRVPNVSELELSSRMQELLDRPNKVVRAPINNDPTMRLEPNRKLAPGCVEEIQYDLRWNYTVFAPHLADNRPGLDGDFVFARDLRGRNEELISMYPDLPAFIYRKGRFEPLGVVRESR